MEQEIDPKTVGGRVINTKKPIQVFDEVKDQQGADTSQTAQPFEIDEIKKVVNDDDSQLAKENNWQLAKDKNKGKQSFPEAHEEDEDTARIGRSGDPLKIKKI